MNIALIISLERFAGENIMNQLLSIAEFKESGEFENRKVMQWINDLNEVRIFQTDTFCIECENIDKQLNWKPDLVIFPITHKSEKGTPSLTVHAPGNWGEAQLGGNDKDLPPTSPAMMKFMLKKLEEYGNHTGHLITMECTHHGPHVETPIIFIEIGSEEKAWKDESLGLIIAKTLKFCLENKVPEAINAVGIGGPHYCPSFLKIMLESDVAIGHVCPKYNIENLDEEMLQKALKACNAKLAVLDWKGLGQEKERITKLLEKLNIGWKKTKEF